MIEGAHHDGEEYAWHPDGADVPAWFVVGWIGMVMLVLAGAGWCVLR